MLRLPVTVPKNFGLEISCNGLSSIVYRLALQVRDDSFAGKPLNGTM